MTTPRDPLQGKIELSYEGIRAMWDAEAATKAKQQAERDAAKAAAKAAMEAAHESPAPASDRPAADVRAAATPTGPGETPPDVAPPPPGAPPPAPPPSHVGPAAPDVPEAAPEPVETPPPPVPTFDPGEVPSVEQIHDCLAVFAKDYLAVEIRVINSFKEKQTFGKTFTDLRRAAKYAHRWSGEAMGVYFTINPLNGLEVKGKTAGDEDVSRRMWLFIDADPERDAHKKDSATDEEKAIAWEALCKVRDWLHGRGWPEPVVCDSGNGWHLFYRIDLPNDDAAKTLVKGVLVALDRQFTTPAVKIDTSVSNASRVTKAYGTLACKGLDTLDRPHRYARVLSVPEDIRPIPVTLLDALANEPPAPGFDLDAEVERKRAQHAPAEARETSRNGKPAEGDSSSSTWVGTSVADDYTARTKWADILEPHKWTVAETLDDGEIRWTRPGKKPEDGCSATTGHDGHDVFHVFSGNAKPFAANGNYSKFDAYAILEHGGDLTAAARVLYREGFGTRQPHPPPKDEDMAWLEAKPTANGTGRAPDAAEPSASAEPVNDGHAPDAAAGPVPVSGAQPERLKKTADVVEAPDDPHKLARTYVAERYAHPEHPRLVHCRADFYEYRDSHYQMIPNADAETDLTAGIKREFDRLYFQDLDDYRRAMAAYQIAKKNGGDPGDTPRPPEARKVKTGTFNDTMRALRSVVSVPHTLQQPCWLSPIPDAPPPMDILPTRNALVHLPSLVAGTPRTILPTPAFFCTYALPYDFDPDAPEPTAWLNFLSQLWPNDPQSIALLQEWFGYMLTADTSQEKMLMIIGPKRAGKGTIARILTALVGPENVSNPTLTKLSTDFGLASLVGKVAAIIPDARLSGRVDQAVIVERLVSITGQDGQSIARKYREDWEGKLSVRFTLLSNELPKLRDAASALPSRMLILRLTNSFLGSEDLGLFDALRAELSGILLWAAEGWDNLRQRGKFTQPDSGRDLVKAMEALASPILTFVAARCRVGVGAGFEVVKDDLYAAWKTWCQENNIEPGAPANLARLLYAAIPRIVDSRPREHGQRIQKYLGLRLKNAADMAEEAAAEKDDDEIAF